MSNEAARLRRIIGGVMADILNFNKARKRRDRAAAELQAAENRVRFGRSREQKALESARAEELRHKLDALRREPDAASAESPSPAPIPEPDRALPEAPPQAPPQAPAPDDPA